LTSTDDWAASKADEASIVAGGLAFVKDADGLTSGPGFSTPGRSLSRIGRLCVEPGCPVSSSTREAENTPVSVRVSALGVGSDFNEGVLTWVWACDAEVTGTMVGFGVDSGEASSVTTETAVINVGVGMASAGVRATEYNRSVSKLRLAFQNLLTRRIVYTVDATDTIDPIWI
jgi:hypothetical protein